MSRLRDDSGFSLVELLVTCAMMIVVFGAVLGAFDAFQRFNLISDNRADAQDSARSVVDDVAQRLRETTSTGTAAVDRALGNDLVVRVVDPGNPTVSGGANTARLMYERFCVNAATGKLYAETLHWTTATAPTLPDASLGPAFPCPGTGWDTIEQLTDAVTTAGGNIFGYTPNASAVSGVSIDLSIDRDPTRPPAAVELRTSITLRNLNLPPTIALSCAAVGSGQAICDSLGTDDPDGQALTYAWSYATASCTPTPVSFTTIPSTQTAINQIGLTPGQKYCFQLVVSDPTGSTSSQIQEVTAS